MPKHPVISSFVPFVTQTQHDAEVKKKEATPPKSYVSKFISLACHNNNGNISDGSDVIDVLVDDSGSGKVEFPADHKPSASSKKQASCANDDDIWYGRITKADLKAKKEKIKLSKKQAAEAKIHAEFHVGQVVYTQRSEVADLEPKLCPGRSRRARIPSSGIIVKQSKLCEKLWLVKFHKGVTMYYYESVLYFGSDASTTNNILHCTKDNLLSVKKVELTLSNDQETVLKDIFLPKILNLPGHDRVTFKQILTKFSTYHPWLTKDILITYIKAYKNNISFNINNDKVPIKKSINSITNDKVFVTPSIPTMDPVDSSVAVGSSSSGINKSKHSFNSDSNDSNVSAKTFFAQK